VDRPYLVAGPDGGHDQEVERAVSGARTVAPAPGGWAEAIDDFLGSLHLGEIRGHNT
jgi:hypothetical protein